ncbi:MAG: HAMP domain-containing histidine kinase [Flavobacteriaceae bacterium]|nr:HAMP domain-containing histidine kinase [Flavobacteriaceae bacterium]
MSDEDTQHLKNLAKQVEKLIELRLLHLRSKEQQVLLEEQHERLKQFAGVISHDMKMPLANLILTSDIIKQKYSGLIGKEGVIYLNYLKDSSLTLSDYITNILRYYESDGATEQPKSTFDTYELLEEVFEMLHLNEQSNISLPEDNMIITTNKSVLEQVFLNLITNALKYNDKEVAEIEISNHQDEEFYYFSVSDNGKGIDPKHKHLIFDLYETLGTTDNKGNKGHGIGLSMVKKICTALGGDIEVQSEVGKGTKFTFWIAKTK